MSVVGHPTLTRAGRRFAAAAYATNGLLPSLTKGRQVILSEIRAVWNMREQDKIIVRQNPI